MKGKSIGVSCENAAYKKGDSNLDDVGHSLSQYYDLLPCLGDKFVVPRSKTEQDEVL